jgi:16S rRNA (cytidine1402-2'-O)-methyltransferase
LGEITVVISGFDPGSREISPHQIVEKVLKYEDSGITRKEAIAEVASEYGISKRIDFDVMVAHKSGEKI